MNQPSANFKSPPHPVVRILVADDEADTRFLIGTHLQRWGYEAIFAEDGVQALAVLCGEEPPPIAILDWSMPGMDGPEICRHMREREQALYVILITGRSSKMNVVEGLTAGADDYIVKPLDADELHARIVVGLRVMALQRDLGERVDQLSDYTHRMERELVEKERLLAALHESNREIEKLRKDFFVVCAWTHRIRFEGRWISMDEFLSKHLHLNLSHGISEEAARHLREEIASDPVQP